ncbi:MAG: ATP-dependent DNA helicase RecG [Parcubacteria group bacterium GW2011_GWA2_38_13]|nr:MAG: ATP-dependent DNA helicase RecG [Parcubacteria group bacterium GW2011_GWA2_38_13]
MKGGKINFTRHCFCPCSSTDRTWVCGAHDRGSIPRGGIGNGRRKTNMISLQTKIEELTRVGKTVAGRLKKLGIVKAQDLIYYFPFRYEDFSKRVSIAELVSGEHVTIPCTIDLIKNRRSFKTRKFITEAVVSDDTGTLKAIWFNQPYITKVLVPGEKIFLSGIMDASYQEMQFINPTYEKQSNDTLNTARIVPIYSLTKNVTQKQLRFLVKQAIHLADVMPEWLPDHIIKKYKLWPLQRSLAQIHFPESFEHIAKAIHRLKFDEVLLQQLAVYNSRRQIKNGIARQLKFQKNNIQEFVSSLPFTLTRDQKIASWEILKDLEKEKPMNRLLEGDVGSGKTIVAAIALLNAALQKYQSVFMAPTEVLAFQHYDKIFNLLTPFKLHVALLTHSKVILNGEKIAKKILYKKISTGDVDIIIGTHALITDDMKFKEVALVVIDEQHRFGVGQRKILKEKSLEKKYSPHFLSMTATPIPRSLALILYGDLDLSIIKEMPQGRKKIITKIVLPRERQAAYDFIKEKIESGELAFVVCPLIDPSDKLGVKSATQEYIKLQKEIFPEIPVGILHGKLKPDEKVAVMEKFKKGEIKILVATSVIEVGIDVPTATVMMIEGAERFGLSQLYQFRGRVGRSHLQSHCFLFSSKASEKTRARLHALIDAKDSFDLAQKDLELRGPGDVFGTDQSGFLDFTIAQITDIEIIQNAKMCAEEVMGLPLAQYPELEKKLQEQLKSVHLE